MNNDNQQFDYDTEALQRSASSSYLNQLKKLPILGPELELELAKRYKAIKCMDSRNKLIEHNLRLVIRYAKKWSSISNLSFGDAIAYGNMGLMHAVEKYDPDKVNPENGKPYRLTTYAVTWIEQYIRSAMMNTDSLIRVPIHAQQAMQSAKIIQQERIQAGLPELSIDELFEEHRRRIPSSNTGKENFAEIINGGYAIAVSDIVFNDEGEEETIYNQIEDPVDFVEELDKNFMMDLVAKSNLNERELFVIVSRFGLDPDVGELSLEETGAAVGKKFGKAVTRERIRQIQVSALNKLKNHLNHRIAIDASNKRKRFAGVNP